MKRSLLLTVAALGMVAVGLAGSAESRERGPIRGMAYRHAQSYAWHGGYYSAAWGTPVALVVPPTAATQTHWGWGVANTRLTPIRHQFERDYPGPGYHDPKAFKPTPPWPSDTNQFGVYYIRGPW